MNTGVLDFIDAKTLADAVGTTPEQIAARSSRYQRIFDAIKQWLPATVTNFLDIGCGRGGIAIRCAKYFPQATAHLLDGASENGKWGGFREGAEPWVDVRVAGRVFATKCPGHRFEVWFADPDAQIPPCELVYSICSWGHHYPIDTYLALARRTLKTGGRLIVDLREGENGKRGAAVLEEHFALIGSEHDEGKKYTRTYWTTR